MPNFLSRRAAWTLPAAGLALALAGCGSSTPAPSASGAPGDPGERPLVLTTFTVTADMARHIAGDRLRVESLTKPGAEIHGYDPTPQDVRKAKEAKLILDNGLGLELWFDRFTKDSGTPHATLTKGITPIPIAGGEAQGHPNPHAWMSPTLGKTYIDNIVSAFSGLDPAGAADFTARGDAYKKQLDQVSSQMTTALATIPKEQRALVTCEGAFSYLAKDAGLSEHYLWPVNAESEATPQSTAAAVDAVRAKKIPAVFCESTVNDKVQRQVAAQSGARYGGALYVDSLSTDGGPVPSYLDLLRYDARTITEALTGKAPTAGASS